MAKLFCLSSSLTLFLAQKKKLWFFFPFFLFHFPPKIFENRTMLKKYYSSHTGDDRVNHVFSSSAADTDNEHADCHYHRKNGNKSHKVFLQKKKKTAYQILKKPLVVRGVEIKATRQTQEFCHSHTHTLSLCEDMWLVFCPRGHTIWKNKRFKKKNFSPFRLGGSSSWMKSRRPDLRSYRSWCDPQF